MAAQSIYDDPDFFAGYMTLPRSVEGLSAIYEWPAFQRLLPALAGLRVLDLGCGLGHFARWARAQGAASVLAVDLSERMLAQAQRIGGNDGITYRLAALEAFSPEKAGSDKPGFDPPGFDPPGFDLPGFHPPGFDLIVSMLALHYIADYHAMARRIANWLAPGGRLAISVEHPIYTASGTANWHMNPDGTPMHWPVDRYRDEGERRTHWFVDGVVKYHRTVETYVNGLLDAGLVLVRLEEPEAESAALLAARPEMREERRRPPFLLLAAQRPQ